MMKPALPNRAKKNPSPRHRAWQSMRILVEWTMGDIESTADITRSNLGKYVALLVKAGYVTCVRKRVGGRKGSYCKYRLIKNTGPKAPVARNYNAVVLDLNTGEAVVIGQPQRVSAKRGASKPLPSTERYNDLIRERTHHVA